MRKKQNQVASQPENQTANPEPENPENKVQPKTDHKVISKTPITSHKTTKSASQKIVREKVKVIIPNGVDYTKTCNHARCVYLIYY